MVKLVEASGPGEIREDDRRAVDKTACRNGTGERVFNGSVRDPGARAALLAPRIYRLSILCESEADKQGHTDDSGGDEPGNQPAM